MQRTAFPKELLSSDNDILYLLLYFASNMGRNELPERWQFLTSEILGGLSEFVLGEEFKYTYAYYQSHPGTQEWGSWANKTLEKVLDSQNKKINPAFKPLFRKLLLFESKSDHGESWWDNELRYCMMFGRKPIISSTWALTVPDAEDVKTRIIPLFSAEILGQFKEIARFMEKYIKQDLEFLNRYGL